MSFYDHQGERGPEARSTSAAVGVAEVTHDVVRDCLSEHIDNSLSDGERARVEGHLLRCPDCRAFRETLKATTDAVRQLPRAAAPLSAKQRLREIARP